MLRPWLVWKKHSFHPPMRCFCTLPRMLSTRFVTKITTTCRTFCKQVTKCLLAFVQHCGVVRLLEFLVPQVHNRSSFASWLPKGKLSSQPKYLDVSKLVPLSIIRTWRCFPPLCDGSTVRLRKISPLCCRCQNWFPSLEPCAWNNLECRTWCSSTNQSRLAHPKVPTSRFRPKNNCQRVC